MAKPDLGTKRVCVACGARFYDLQKSPATCPKCGADQPVDQPRVRRPAGNVPEDKRPKKVAPEADDIELDVEAADDDADEDVLEDTSDLEDDDDTLGEAVIVVETNPDEER